jgi:putative SOS response-associated peptidase YedK
MVITEPNKFVAEVHDRMPVILEAKDFEPWSSVTPRRQGGVNETGHRGRFREVAGVKAGEQFARSR